MTKKTKQPTKSAKKGPKKQPAKKAPKKPSKSTTTATEESQVSEPPEEPVLNNCFIERVTFKSNYTWNNTAKTVFDSGLVIDLKPGVNLLVGDQGAGKSTLIELLRSSIEAAQPRKGQYGRLASYSGNTKLADLVEIKSTVPLSEINLIALDFEHDAVRMRASFDWEGPLDVSYQMSAMRQSHGQANQQAMAYMLNQVVAKWQAGGQKLPPTVIIFDEPDAALSIKSVAQVLVFLTKLAEKFGCQVISSAHHPFLVGCFPEVYSLEEKKWIQPAKFFLKQLLDPAGMLLLSRYKGIK